MLTTGAQLRYDVVGACTLTSLTIGVLFSLHPYYVPDGKLKQHIYQFFLAFSCVPFGVLVFMFMTRHWIVQNAKTLIQEVRAMPCHTAPSVFTCSEDTLMSCCNHLPPSLPPFPFRYGGVFPLENEIKTLIMLTCSIFSVYCVRVCGCNFDTSYIHCRMRRSTMNGGKARSHITWMLQI